MGLNNRRKKMLSCGRSGKPLPGFTVPSPGGWRNAIFNGGVNSVEVNFVLLS